MKTVLLYWKGMCPQSRAHATFAARMIPQLTPFLLSVETAGSGVNSAWECGNRVAIGGHFAQFNRGRANGPPAGAAESALAALRYRCFEATLTRSGLRREWHSQPTGPNPGANMPRTCQQPTTPMPPIDVIRSHGLHCPRPPTGGSRTNPR